MLLSDFITDFPFGLPDFIEKHPWKLMHTIKDNLIQFIEHLGEDFKIRDGVAIHESAVVENWVTFKPPVIVSAGCKIGANAYLREGVFLGQKVKIGPGCEIKSSVICGQSAIAHLSYIGNSIIGSRVNFEGGSVVANHYNERTDKAITVLYDHVLQNTGLTKFGALVGDDAKIGANAVLSPGTILEKHAIVKRLALIEQVQKGS